MASQRIHAAAISAVCPLVAAAAFTAMPASSSRRTALMFPTNAESISSCSLVGLYTLGGSPSRGPITTPPRILSRESERETVESDLLWRHDSKLFVDLVC